MREIFFIGVVFSLFDELSFDRMSLRRKIEKEREREHPVLNSFCQRANKETNRHELKENSLRAKKGNQDNDKIFMVVSFVAISC